MHSQPLWSIVVIVVLAALFVACAEARNPGGPAGGGGSGSSGGGQTTTTSGGGGSGQTTTAGTTGGSAGAALPLVINEIAATGAVEYVEIVNPTSDPVSLGELALADTDAVNGGPKLADAARFPKDTSIQPGEHLVVLCGQAAGDGVGPHGKCGSGGPDTCYYATWSVSAKNGEKVFLLSPDDAVIQEAEYPKDAAANGDSWGRFPDSTGDFAETKPTPGEANSLP